MLHLIWKGICALLDSYRMCPKCSSAISFLVSRLWSLLLVLLSRALRQMEVPCWRLKNIDTAKKTEERKYIYIRNTILSSIIIACPSAIDTSQKYMVDQENLVDARMSLNRRKCPYKSIKRATGIADVPYLLKHLSMEYPHPQLASILPYFGRVSRYSIATYCVPSR